MRASLEMETGRERAGASAFGGRFGFRALGPVSVGLVGLVGLVALSAVWGSSVALAQDGAEPVNGQQFGEWTYTCQAISASRTVCGIQQLRKFAESDQFAVRAELGRSGDADGGEIVLSVLIPALGINLRQPAAIRIDEEETAIAAPWLTCTPEGCLTAIAVTGEYLGKMKAGKGMTVWFLPHQSTELQAREVSLKGITAALRALGL